VIAYLVGRYGHAQNAALAAMYPGRAEYQRSNQQRKRIQLHQLIAIEQQAATEQKQKQLAANEQAFREWFSTHVVQVAGGFVSVPEIGNAWEASGGSLVPTSRIVASMGFEITRNPGCVAGLKGYRLVNLSDE